MNKKTFLAFSLVGILIGLPQFAVSSENIPDRTLNWRLETQGWSIQDHMAAAQGEVETVQSIENRIQQMDTRIAKLEKKAYLDPKGINKNALALLSGNLKKKLDLLKEKVGWHFRQADHAKLVE